MDWKKVAEFLDDEGTRLLKGAPTTIPDDLPVRREMLSRGVILITCAEALRAGLSTNAEHAAAMAREVLTERAEEHLPEVAF